MALYTRDSIDSLRDAVDMEDLVGTKTDLRRVGSRLTGLCPFHDERTPSFSVNVADKLFYCFGCHAKGDAIGFVEQTEGLDFRESVEFLAERYGVELELENEDPQAETRRRRKERLLALLDRAARFYASYLWESGEAAAAREYLAGRGLSEGDPAWVPGRLLAQRLGPYADGRAPRRVLGRGADGRGARPARPQRRHLRPLPGPHHVSPRRWAREGARLRRAPNGGRGAGRSTSTPVRTRSTTRAVSCSGSISPALEAAKSGRIVLVEGYTDVLALHQAGIRETAAIMGTDSPTSSWPRWAGWPHGSSWLSTPTAPGRRRCCAPRGWPRTGAGPPRGGDARGDRSGGARDCGRRRCVPGADGAGARHDRVSRWAAFLPMQTSTPHRAETGRCRRPER